MNVAVHKTSPAALAASNYATSGGCLLVLCGRWARGCWERAIYELPHTMDVDAMQVEQPSDGTRLDTDGNGMGPATNE